MIERPEPTEPSVGPRWHRAALLLVLALGSTRCAGKAFTDDFGDGDASSPSDATPPGDAAPEAEQPLDARPPSDGSAPADATADGSKPADGGHDASPPPLDASSPDGHTGSDASDGAACAKPCGTLCCTAVEVCCNDSALGGGTSCPPIGSLCPAGGTAH